MGDAVPAKCIGGTFAPTSEGLKPDLMGTYVSACEFVGMSAFAVLRKYLQYFYCLKKEVQGHLV